LYAQARWTNRDRKVSYLALRTSYDDDGNRSVRDGGLYSLAVNPDSLSSHTVVAMSGAPLVSMVMAPPGHMLLQPSYAWKADGSAVVFRVPPDQDTTAGMWHAAASGGFANPTLLTESGSAEYRGSPNGTHIVYSYCTRKLRTGAVRWNIWRATATGSSATNLTSSHDTGGSFPKWSGTGNPPTVTITQPANASDVWGTITIKTTATDDGTIDEVEFFVDGTSIGTDFTSPYEINWISSNVSDGDHTISAKATDNVGKTDTNSISVTVNNSPTTLSVTSVSPNTVRVGKSIDVTVKGAGFISGASLALKNGSGPFRDVHAEEPRGEGVEDFGDLGSQAVAETVGGSLQSAPVIQSGALCPDSV